MTTLIWIVYVIYVILATMVFKRVGAEQVYYPETSRKVLHMLVLSAFWALLVGLPGYLLHKYLPSFPSWP